MADYRGRPLVVNFWATDCAVCVREMPDRVRTYNRHRAHGLELVAVAMQHDRPDHVVRFAESRLHDELGLIGFAAQFGLPERLIQPPRRHRPGIWHFDAFGPMLTRLQAAYPPPGGLE